VVIERLPYAECIRRYDSKPGTLFYLDPPYWGCTDDYGRNIFEVADFERLRELLASLHGQFILSINDTPEIRTIFSDFAMREVSLHYGVGGGQRPARELIITPHGTFR
jgi:DNA adenine methylase